MSRSESHADPVARTARQEVAAAARARLADYLMLTKPRVTAMVLLTTLAGFYMGSTRGLDAGLLLRTLFGTALAAAGASALNQYLERDGDGRMRRTRGRPLPGGRLDPQRALLFGSILATAGILFLAPAVNALAAGLVALTLLTYVLLYTPLKTRSPLCTLVGSLPGALPPLVGSVAAEGRVTAVGVGLFAILFVWQLPHALAIACLYRDDYDRGGYLMLPVVAGDNAATGRIALLYALALVPVTLLPVVWGGAGPLYLGGALLLGGLHAVAAAPLARTGSLPAARRLLLASVVYLPVLLSLMAFDRQPGPR
ncbi:MAG TPA: heme o synthase [Candidatus Polarisedimenticolia bacterium]|nr:heme o synthase [Candidatus Polarisedimenticolia bacterium]